MKRTSAFPRENEEDITTDITEIYTIRWCSRQSYVETWGRRRNALLPASKRRDNTGPVALEPPMAMFTPSWRKVVASGMGTPWSSTAGAPCSPCTEEQDLSTRTSCPVIRSHYSVAGTVSWSAAAPRATAWVSSA